MWVEVSGVCEGVWCGWRCVVWVKVCGVGGGVYVGVCSSL